MRDSLIKLMPWMGGKGQLMWAIQMLLPIHYKTLVDVFGGSGIITLNTAVPKGCLQIYTGMQIMAHFTNGVTKDVTQYMTWSEEPLTAEDTDFQLEYPIVMYQNKDGAEGEYPKPIATVKLIIKSDIMCGDVDGDGKITVTDAMYIFQYLGQRRELDNDALKAADTDKDGKITVTDAMYIFQYLGQRRELN